MKYLHLKIAKKNLQMTKFVFDEDDAKPNLCDVIKIIFASSSKKYLP
jgi:hypothetical protein